MGGAVLLSPVLLVTCAHVVNVVIVFRAAGEHERARELDRTALSKIRDLFPDAQVILAAVEPNSGNDLFALGRLKEARAQDAVSGGRVRSPSVNTIPS